MEAAPAREYRERALLEGRSTQTRRIIVGRPVGYKLMPTNCVNSFLMPAGPSGQRSNFVENHLWVTAYDAGGTLPGR